MSAYITIDEIYKGACCIGARYENNDTSEDACPSQDEWAFARHLKLVLEGGKGKFLWYSGLDFYDAAGKPLQGVDHA